VKDRGVPSGYVEGLNDARTLLADFFSILLVKDTDCGWFIVSVAFISHAATGDHRSR